MESKEGIEEEREAASGGKMIYPDVCFLVEIIQTNKIVNKVLWSIKSSEKNIAGILLLNRKIVKCYICLKMIVAQGCGYKEMMQSSHRGRSVSHTERFTGRHYFRKLTPVQGWGLPQLCGSRKISFLNDQDPLELPQSNGSWYTNNNSDL